FPYSFFDFLKYLSFFKILQKLSVTFLMTFFDRAYSPEPFCKIMKTFFLGIFRHALIHICPLIIFSCCCRQEVVLSCPDVSQFLIPQAGMFLFVAGCLEE